MKEITLDPRLERVFQMVPACETCADIGADHGFLSAKLLQSGKVRHTCTCDISAPSLDKARRLFAGDPLEAHVTFGVGNGLEPVEGQPDACVIAGMGGETIIGILTRGWDKVKNASLILQPNVDADEVRAFLDERGFTVTDEDLIFDGKWWYSLILAKPLGSAHLTQKQLLAGPVLLNKRHPLLPDYAARQVRILTKALSSLPEGNEREKPLTESLNIWKEIAQWQR